MTSNKCIKVGAITIGFDDLQDLRVKQTGNPIAEEKVPEMLRTTIKTRSQPWQDAQQKNSMST